jgi:hypothetical protein
MSSVDRLRHLLLDNLTLKISSLALATILWVHATTLHTYDEVLAVKLEVSGIPDSMVTLSPLPDRVQVAFRGKGDQLWWLYARQPRVVVAVEGLQPGPTLLSLFPSNVHVPSGLDVQVTDVVAPRTIQLDVDMMTRKTVPILVETAGLPAPGFVRVTENIDVDPPHVTLEGPLSVIEDVDRVRTEPLDVANAKGMVSRRVRLSLPSGPRLSASLEAVTAQVRFERLVRRSVDVRPERNRPLREGWGLVPEQVRMHLWAPSSLEDSLLALDPAVLHPVVIIPRNPRDSTMLDVSVENPQWVRQCTIDPPRVMLRRIAAPG